jgi:hypothetical protein
MGKKFLIISERTIKLKSGKKINKYNFAGEHTISDVKAVLTSLINEKKWKPIAVFNVADARAVGFAVTCSVKVIS